MRAKFINEAFERKDKEAARNELLHPGYSEVVKNLNGNYINIIDFMHTPWSHMFVELGTKIIRIISGSTDPDEEKEFFDIFGDVLIDRILNSEENSWWSTYIQIVGHAYGHLWSKPLFEAFEKVENKIEEKGRYRPYSNDYFINKEIEFYLSFEYNDDEDNSIGFRYGDEIQRVRNSRGSVLYRIKDFKNR